MINRYFRCSLLLLCFILSFTVCGFADEADYVQVIKPQYDAAGGFCEGLAWIRIGDYNTGKYGLIDKAGNEVVPPKYDTAGDFCEGLASVRFGDYQTGKWGYVDKKGSEVVPCKYDYAESFSNGLAAVKHNGKWGFIDTLGNEVVPCKYDHVYDFFDGLARVGIGDEDSGVWGFVNTKGQEVIPCQYSRVGEDGDFRWWTAGEHPFSEGLAAAWLPGGGNEDDGITGKLGIIDQTGKAVVPFELEYDETGMFHDGLIAVMEIDQVRYHDEIGGDEETRNSGEASDEDEAEEDYEITFYAKVGFMDTEGKLVIPPIYTCPYYVGNGCLDPVYIMPEFSEGLAAVMNGDRQENRYHLSNNGKFGYIDEEGNVVVPFVYDYAAPFSEGLAYVCQGDKYGFIDATGKVVVALAYDCNYYHGCADTGGRLVEEFFSGGFASISKIDPESGLRYGMIDKTGNVVIPPQHARVDRDADVLATVYGGYAHHFSHYLNGFAVMADEEVILIDKYDDVRTFSEGFAAVALGEEGVRKWGFIDTSGEEVVPCVYEDVNGFSDGLAAVRVDGKWGYITLVAQSL